MTKTEKIKFENMQQQLDRLNEQLKELMLENMHYKQELNKSITKVGKLVNEYVESTR